MAYAPVPREAMDSVFFGLAARDRGKEIMVCGTGKTFMALQIYREQSPFGGTVPFLFLGFEAARSTQVIPSHGAGYPSMLWGRPRGLSSRRASGSSAAGRFWNATGRRKRAMDAVPTAVAVDAVVAGYGPPCCWA